ncbi:hypothetical protein M409DRAFT_60338 [Zasmidium cellare ATCC 36951]|uniref:PCI domain-containing protein n=1 Tax=Zasmidium cellare ATCC 36951 TaxID=1080233 RepID=A0A6A6BYQ2_ZASCE|nr:uncharacterized protein M409DRAFT_60338 [Zasmidium cellare ATCC 36951]KAF2159924.1 hypothetical protein M409DRAFT_60338 [Zasmidium cellare ATCC 36951]
MAPKNGIAADLPPPTFDLEIWANHYENGPLLQLRLAHVAARCPSLAHHALTLALADAKKGKDVQIYNRLCDLAADLGLKDLGKQDTEWASRKDEENRRELSRLESELRGYKNNLIRESIRMGQEELAMHHLLTGGPIPDPANPQSLSSAGYNAAYQAFGKMRDFCTTPAHINSMTLRLIYTALLQAVTAQQTGNSSSSMHFNSVIANSNRLRATGVKEEEQSKLTPMAHVVAGIAHMGIGEYRSAASAFLQTPFDYHNSGGIYNVDFERSVASANDVAIYGGLCALATMSREALIDDVLGGPFRAFLEQEPHMRKAIVLYTTAKYQACIDTLRRYYSDWSLDVFLGAGGLSTGSHVDRLFARIRERSITAYFSSFSEVSLTSLASTFPPTSNAPDAMEAEVLNMIENGTLDARLDVVSGVLVAPQNDTRLETHQNAQKAAQEVERTLLLRLHRVNMTLAGLEIPKAKGQWDGMRVGNGY